MRGQGLLRATTTEAMYLYYAVVLLYRRILTTLTHNGEFVAEHQDMENIFRYLQYYCLKDLAMYLGSIGNFTDYTDHLAYFNIQSRFSSKSIFGAKSHFGKVGATTHWKYKTMSSPLVFLLRIIEDLRVSTNPEAPADWDLPAEIIPTAPGYDLKPNVNLLGWVSDVPMSGDQRREVIRCNFTVDESLGVSRNPWGGPINLTLMSSISQSIAKAKGLITIPGSGMAEGSMSQVMYTQTHPDSLEPVPKKDQAVSKGVRVYSDKYDAKVIKYFHRKISLEIIAPRH